MPSSTRTINQFQAVSVTNNGGNLAVFPWGVAGNNGPVVSGIYTGAAVTFPVDGPYPTIDYQDEGFLTVTGASFTPNVPVFLDSSGLLTQGTAYGQAAVNPYVVAMGIAVTSTQVLLKIGYGMQCAASAAALPTVVSDALPYPHTPANGAELVALKYSLGIGVGGFPAANGDIAIDATTNTSLTFKYQGSDGVVRSVSLTLS